MIWDTNCVKYAEYWLYLTRISLYKDKIEDYILIRENAEKTCILVYFTQ